MVVPEGNAADAGETSASDRSGRIPDGSGRVPDGSAWRLTGEQATAFRERDPEEIDDATELYLLGRHAASDGTVTVQLLGWERDDDVVRVDYALPTGERHSDTYRWPTPGRYADSDFLAIVRGLGYAPAAADLVVGEFARARRENGRWRIVTGREPDAAPTGGGDRDAGDGRNGEPLGEAGDESVRSGKPGDPTGPSLSLAVRRRLRRADPMTTGSVAVLLLVLSVLLPAALAGALGGITTWIAALGAALFAASAAALGLSIAAVS